MQDIDNRLKLILATGVAKSLTPFVSQPSVTQMISSNVTPTGICLCCQIFCDVIINSTNIDCHH